MKISIVTINYNNSAGLEETIKSVVSQNPDFYEYIIIDGKSTDDSVDVIKKYSEYVSYWISEPDKGVFDAMNKGIDVATGAYCIFMNSGDSFYASDVIEKFVRINPTAQIYVGITAEHIQGNVRLWKPMKEEDLCMNALYRGSISHQASFIQTSLMKKSRYDSSLRIAADWKFFIESLILSDAAYQPLPFIVANYMDGGISRDEKAAFEEREKILQQLFSKRQIRDFHRAYYGISSWDRLSKKVNPNSKRGKVISFLVETILKL